MYSGVIFFIVYLFPGKQVNPMKIDHNSNSPLHYQAEVILRKLIESEEYRNGKLLPNEVALSEQLGISRNTLRQAIKAPMLWLPTRSGPQADSASPLDRDERP